MPTLIDDLSWVKSIRRYCASGLDRDHRIDGSVERQARQCLSEYQPRPSELVPTHGGWQPRNWITNYGRLSVIDFGRFDLPAGRDGLLSVGRATVEAHPAVETAFLRGYGADPRAGDVWRIDMLREAVGTAVWAYQVGDEAFETQGHRMLTEALDRL